MEDMIKEYKEINSLVNNILDSPGKGGNISVKFGDNLLIKSSGADMKIPHSVSVMSMRDDEVIGGYVSTEDDYILSNFTPKPSMEWKMHKHFCAKYVLHYHPIYVLPYLCSDYEFDESFKFSVVDYVEPGDELSYKIGDLKLWGPGVVYLRNHGVVIYGDSVIAVKLLYNKIKSKYFSKNTNVYTPDDLVDQTSPDLWLFRHAIENISRSRGLQLNSMSITEQESLLNNKDEKYRMEKM